MSKATPLDLVLIDDDPLIQAAWKICADSKGHTILCCNNLREFETFAVSKQVPVYIDYLMNDQVTGIEIANKLHQMGYENLFITTGFSKNSISVPTSIREVISKEYPEF